MFSCEIDNNNTKYINYTAALIAIIIKIYSAMNIAASFRTYLHLDLSVVMPAVAAI